MLPSGGVHDTPTTPKRSGNGSVTMPDRCPQLSGCSRSVPARSSDAAVVVGSAAVARAALADSHRRGRGSWPGGCAGCDACRFGFDDGPGVVVPGVRVRIPQLRVGPGRPGVVAVLAVPVGVGGAGGGVGVDDAGEAGHDLLGLLEPSELVGDDVLAAGDDTGELGATLAPEDPRVGELCFELPHPGRGLLQALLGLVAVDAGAVEVALVVEVLAWDLLRWACCFLPRPRDLSGGVHGRVEQGVGGAFAAAAGHGAGELGDRGVDVGQRQLGRVLSSGWRCHREGLSSGWRRPGDNRTRGGGCRGVPVRSGVALGCVGGGVDVVLVASAGHRDVEVLTIQS